MWSARLPSRLLLAAAAALCAAPVAGLADWLVSRSDVGFFPTFTNNTDGTATLSNGLISRTFCFSPGFGTVDFYSHVANASLLRAIDVEAYLSLDGQGYALGGIIQTGTYYHAYINRSDLGVAANADGWDAVSLSLSSPTAPFPWTPGTRGSPADASWPPSGLTLAVKLRAPASAPPSHRAIDVTLVYEMYPGIPLLTTWLVVASTGPAAAGVVVTGAVPATLRLARQYSPFSLGALSPAGDGLSGDTFNPVAALWAQTDEPHGTAVQWLTDGAAPADPGAVEAQLVTNYTSGPGVVMGGGAARPARRLHSTRLAGTPPAEFVSFRTFLLVTDTFDVERRGLAVQRLYALWAPHVLESPVFFHATDTSDAGFKLEVDQMAAVGFEMLIYSFGSGFNLETADPAYLATVKAQIAYAKGKGIEVGGYDLICLDRGEGGYGGNVGVQWDAVAPDGSLKEDACFASGWFDKLNDYAYGFINETGLSMLETDGPYGGGACSSTNHTYHVGFSDSVYQQTRVQAEWYAGLRARNVFINQPDYYYFFGGQKSGYGYDEDQYSLPREQDLTVSRMTVYDQSIGKLPTMGWMFLPLIDYHGGGADAAFDPMSEHLPEYELGLAQYLLAGVAACYRGFRLYDTPAVQAVAARYVGIYKAYRDIITSPIAVHVRRPDGQSIDGYCHANAFLPVNKAFCAFFNPTTGNLTAVIPTKLYYAGITTTALVSHEGGAPAPAALARDYTVPLTVSLGPRGVTCAEKNERRDWPPPQRSRPAPAVPALTLTDAERRVRELASDTRAITIASRVALARPRGPARNRALEAVAVALAAAGARASALSLDDKLLVLGLTVANGYEEDAGLCVGLCRQSWREGFLLTSAMHEAAKRARKAAAAWTGHLSQVPKQRTHLHFAAEHGRVDRLRVLLQSGAAVNSRDSAGATPLYCASWKGHTAIVAALLAARGVAVNAATTNGYTPLHVASRDGDLAVVAALLAAPDVAVNAATTDGFTPLIAASLNGHTAVVVALLAAPGVSVNAADIVGWTSLHFASIKGHTAVVSALLAHPAIDVNMLKADGSTPLSVARRHGHVGVAALLEARGGVV